MPTATRWRLTWLLSRPSPTESKRNFFGSAQSGRERPRRRTDDRGRRTEDRRRKTEDRGRNERDTRKALSERIQSFRDLRVYQAAFQLQQMVFEVTRTFPGEERFALTDQFRRAARSIGAER
ncbi:MAG: four helix bundle protein [Verrucomicrobiia bacterium]